MRSLHHVSLSLFWSCIASAHLHLIEPSQVNCPGGAGHVDVVISEHELSTDRFFQPYMLAFFWERGGPLSLDCQLLDAKNRTLITESVFQLDAGARRLYSSYHTGGYSYRTFRTVQDIFWYHQIKGAMDDIKAASELVGGEVCKVGEWHGSCQRCLEEYAPSRCEIAVAAPENMSRLDLEDENFIPSRWKFPLKLRVSKVKGPEFEVGALEAAGLCGSKISNTSKKMLDKEKQLLQKERQIFVMVIEVPTGTEEDDGLFARHPQTAVLFFVFLVGGLCCCLASVAACIYYGQKYANEYEQLERQ